MLDAVIDTTATYSRLEDTVAISELARFVYDVDQPTGWQRKRVTEGCQELRRHGIITYKIPTGRRRAGVNQYAIVGLPTVETHPGSGVLSPVEIEECTLVPRETHPDFARNAPDTGGHTEKDSEEDSEKRDGLAFALSYFKRVNKRVNPDEVRTLVAALQRNGVAEAEVPDRLRGCNWPSQVSVEGNRRREAPPPCDRGCSNGWLPGEHHGDDSIRCTCNPKEAERQRIRDRAADAA